jgi:hypothetical protein
MIYPFQINIDPNICRKLKIMSLASKTPISKLIPEIIQRVWDQCDQNILLESEKNLA